MMVPAAAVDSMIAQLAPRLAPGDTLIDGGNSYYIDDIRRGQELAAKGIHYVDVGTSGGVWGLERGYCQMIGGENEVVTRLDPIFKTLAPGRGTIDRTPGRPEKPNDGKPNTAEEGYLHCGPVGAGHFVKMVHNGIEYGLMAAYAEGLNILRHANAGLHARTVDAETTPLRNPEHYQYELNLADITEVWRRGSVVASWLLDLTAAALAASPGLDKFSGRVSDSGEGRWTIQAAIDESAPAPVLERRALSALHLARRRRFRRQSFIRPALSVWRPRRNQGRSLILDAFPRKSRSGRAPLAGRPQSQDARTHHPRKLSSRRPRFGVSNSRTRLTNYSAKKWADGNAACPIPSPVPSSLRFPRRQFCAHSPAQCPATWG